MMYHDAVLFFSLSLRRRRRERIDKYDDVPDDYIDRLNRKGFFLMRRTDRCLSSFIFLTDNQLDISSKTIENSFEEKSP